MTANDTTTASDDTSTETARQAADLGLPRVAWQEGGYRLVLRYNDEDNTIERIPERLCGYDALGHERWEPLGLSTWDERTQQHVVPADWAYLAHQMAVDIAPLSAADHSPYRFAGEVIQTEYTKALETIHTYANEQMVENATAVALVLESIAEKLGLHLSSTSTGTP